MTAHAFVRNSTLAVVFVAALSGCSVIAGFESFTYSDGSAGKPGSTGKGGAGGAAAGMSGAGGSVASGGGGSPAQAGMGGEPAAAGMGGEPAAGGMGGEPGTGGMGTAGMGTAGMGTAGMGTAGMGGTSGTAGAGGAADPCPPDTKTTDTDGRVMVKMPGLQAGECVWMDRNEVSRAKYDEFVKSNKFVAELQPTECKTSNTNITPDPTCLAKVDAKGDLETPVTCVDWCDAAAFCKWAGKRLCQGSFSAFTDSTKSEWMSACSNGGKTLTPSGADSIGGQCNVGCVQTPCPLYGVEDNADCSNARGIMNLVGNASEWTAECKNSAGPDDLCRIRGGSFTDGEDSTCEIGAQLARNTADDPSVGFRCCLDDN